jgi:beta-lactamase class D
MITRMLLFIVLFSTTIVAQLPSIDQIVRTEMAGKTGTCVFINCASTQTIVSDSGMASERQPPCSSFKIWNTLIGVKCGIIAGPDKLFYKWDGETRSRAAWNRDQTLKEAFQGSCVPAFQQLARKIGDERMVKWIETIGYGDKDISSGIDDFWLPREGKKSIIISPAEQAQLVKRLVLGELPFSEKAQKVLREIMLVKKTPRGSLYGKTGTGTISVDPESCIGWYVGYVKSKDITWSFACLIKGEKVTGNDSKDIIEAILLKGGLL